MKDKYTVTFSDAKGNKTSKVYNRWGQTATAAGILVEVAGSVTIKHEQVADPVPAKGK